MIAFVQTVSPSTAQQGQIVRQSQANSSTQSQPDDSTRQVYTVIGDYQVSGVQFTHKTRIIEKTGEILGQMYFGKDL